jgi:hypothetical protein
MTSVSDICDVIGRGRLATALGVRKTAISNAVVQGRFPAKWFKVISDLSVDHGIECPEALFTFVEKQPPVADGATSFPKEAAE